LFFGLLVSVVIPNRAVATEHHLQNWSVYVMRVNVIGSWSAYFELQPRTDILDSRLDRLLIRPAVMYSLSPELNLALGYGAIASFDPVSWEHRIWQQVQYVQKWEARSLTHRLRLEQRFLPGADSVGMRFRYFARFYVPWSDGAGWGPLFSNELFLAFNSPLASVSSGFDQNRVFAGLNFDVGPHFRVEAGYLNNYVRRPAPKEGLMNHAGLLGIYVSF
jgi:hypothetical protein